MDIQQFAYSITICYNYLRVHFIVKKNAWSVIRILTMSRSTLIDSYDIKKRIIKCILIECKSSLIKAIVRLR